MDKLTNSKWIWNSKENKTDKYVEFIGNFACKNKGIVTLNLSFDTVCNVYINNQLVFFKKCSDYPFYKLYDSVDVTKFCKNDINEIKFCVWYYGEDNASYYSSNAGLIFEVVEGDNILLSSNSDILCRQNINYKNGYCKNITGQLGYSFYYDNTVENTLPYLNSVEIEKTTTLFKNPLKQLDINKNTNSKLVYKSNETALYDLGREEVGFLTLDIESSEEQEILVCYGEHIVDGKVRRNIDGRDFSCELKLKKGSNVYTSYFRRLAGRYIQIYNKKPLTVNYIGLKTVYYPTIVSDFKCNTELEQQIYNTAVRTLTLCMHEHYEDCPWREQAMYVLDSKNQMLCGYYAFKDGNFEYSRHQLVLMSKGVTDDGLLELTYPAKDTPSIPFFSIMYPVTVLEYIKHSKDTSILNEVIPVVEKIVKAFKSRVDSNGLIPTLPYPYWNFYEWSLGSDRNSEIRRSKDEKYIKQYDLILNCSYVLCLEAYQELKGETINLARLKEQIHNTFYNKEKGLYFSDTNHVNLYTELGNSFTVLSGVAKNGKEIAEKLKTQSELVEITLSMLGFKYDALLKVDKSNKEYIFNDIRKKYGYMLDNNATSFWETIKGEKDFNGAGSLCHGWSSLPIYYFSIIKE